MNTGRIICGKVSVRFKLQKLCFEILKDVPLELCPYFRKSWSCGK
jgi:hypothetical protein